MTLKGKKLKQSHKPFRFHDLYRVKFNYFDTEKNVWVKGVTEDVLTPVGKKRHSLAAKMIRKKYCLCEIVSVIFC